MDTEREKDNREPWTTGELAEAAGVTETRIRQLLLDERLNGYKLARDWRIPDHVAREWLAQRAEVR